MDTLSPQVHGPHSRAASPLSFRLLCTILLATGVGERAHDVRAAALGGKIPSLRTHGSLDTLSPYVHGPGQSRPCPLSLLMQGSLGLRPCPVIWPVTSSRRLAPKRLPFCPPLLLLLQQPQHPRGTGWALELARRLLHPLQLQLPQRQPILWQCRR